MNPRGKPLRAEPAPYESSKDKMMKPRNAVPFMFQLQPQRGAYNTLALDQRSPAQNFLAYQKGLDINDARR
jgi:hypothetical protein